MGFVLSPRAKADIDDIWAYTVERWGLAQAEHYVGLIGRAVAAAGERPGLGHACDDVREGYFKLRVGSHLIFYRLQGADIDVVRVLHGRMDAGRHV
jgi:toxin ParE1/3/4